MFGVPKQVREASPDLYAVLDYNRAGNIVRMDSFTGADSIHFAREEYFYDSTGVRLEHLESHDLLKNTVRTMHYNYDKRGYLSSEVEHLGPYRNEFSHNRKGYLKKETVYVPDDDTGQDPQTRYKYNLRGQLKKIHNGEFLEKYHYHPDGSFEIDGEGVLEKYDKNGLLQSVTHTIKFTDDKARTKSFVSAAIIAVYEFDTHGNWIRRTQMQEQEPFNVTVREIDYWDEP